MVFTDFKPQGLEVAKIIDHQNLIQHRQANFLYTKRIIRIKQGEGTRLNR
jgi:hypothetical protein